MSEPVSEPMSDLLASLLRKQGRELLTDVRGYGPTDAAELRHLFQEMRRYRNDPAQDAREDVLAWGYIYLRDWRWQSRDLHEDQRARQRYFICKHRGDTGEVVAIGEQAADFRLVCAYPAYHDFSLEQDIEQAADDEAVLRAIAHWRKNHPR